MNLPMIAMGVAAGIAIEAAVVHGMVGWSRRPRDRARLAFAAASVAVAAGALSAVALYSAQTPEAHAAVMKWLFFPASVAWTVSSLWFVAFYTNVRPMRLLVALTAGFCAVLAADLLLPYGLLSARLGELRSISVTGADVMIVAHPSPHPLNLAADALSAAALLFVFYALWSAWRRGQHHRVLTLSPAAALLVAATVVDGMTDHGIVSSLYLTQLSFAAVVILLSVTLRRESLDDESELRRHRAELETLVGERVRELDVSNERLAAEVRERTLAKDALASRVAELDWLERVSRTLARRTDITRALEVTTGEIAVLFGSAFARVFLVTSDEGREDTLDAAALPGVPALAGGYLAPAEAASLSWFERVFVRQEVASVSDVSPHDVPPGLEEPVRTLAVHKLLVVPMVAGARVVGALIIARGLVASEFSSADANLALTVADTLAGALDNERLHREETTEAAARERSRLARDLHDTVTQNIASANLIAEALPAVWERDPQQGREHLDSLRRLVRAALSEMRTLLFELRPAALEAAPLDDLVKRLADSLAGRLQIPVDVTTDPDGTLPPATKVAMYRMAQEAFSNIVRHARPSRVCVEFASEADAVTLKVEDDGVGFDAGLVAPTHMGLRIMQERAQRARVSLEVRSAPGKGTSVVMAWSPDAATPTIADGRSA